MTGLTAEGLVARRDGFTLGPVDLRVAAGSAVAVIGPSGAGKTTLLRALAGFLPLLRGRIDCDGADMTAMPPERRRLGFVPQGLGLFPHRTVEANVRYPLELRDRREAPAIVRSLLERFGLDGLAEARPHRLSGGEQQRVAMARALAAEPRLLLWDEPLSALDLVARQGLIDLLKGVLERDRIPLVLVTHDPETAASLADGLLVLASGTVRFSGSLADLVRQPRDRFTARFAGYPNIYSPAELARAAGTPFGQWLSPRAGPDGVCVAAELVRRGSGSADFVGRLRVHRRRPAPAGEEVWGELDGLPLVGRIPGDEGGLPFATEAETLVGVRAAAVRPIGRADPAAERGA